LDVATSAAVKQHRRQIRCGGVGGTAPTIVLKWSGVAGVRAFLVVVCWQNENESACP